MIEDANRQMLLYLSKGFKIKELDGYHMSSNKRYPTVHYPYEKSLCGNR
jgi:hypothetical protein